MRERPSLRRQDLERRLQLLRGRRRETSETRYQRQQEYRSSHEVEYAVDFKPNFPTIAPLVA
jgi:hypothetical protein